MLLIKKLVKELKKEFPEIKEENFQFPGRFGDISCNICFIKGTKIGKNPREIASEKIKKIELPEEFEKVEEKKWLSEFLF